MEAGSGTLALPVYFSENYFTLLPGENRDIAIDLTHLPKTASSIALTLEIEGWNIENKTLNIKDL